MTKIQGVSCVLLAAGSSTRFGSNKLLHCLANNKSLLASSLGLYSKVFSKVTVVVDPANLEINNLCSIIVSQGADYIFSPNAQLGLSQSLVAGITASLPERGWLIALADMPYLKVATINALCGALRHDNIVVPVSVQGVGNPVAFGVDFSSQLLEVEGDAGAKSVVQANYDASIKLAVDDLGIHHDIDQVKDIKT